jgi:hypothetical protein
MHVTVRAFAAESEAAFAAKGIEATIRPHVVRVMHGSTSGERWLQVSGDVIPGHVELVANEIAKWVSEVPGRFVEIEMGEAVEFTRRVNHFISRLAHTGPR